MQSSLQSDGSCLGDEVHAENREDPLLPLNDAELQHALDAMLAGDPVPTETETHWHALSAGAIAEQLSREVDFSHVHKLLDISAEDGALSRVLCEQYLELSATVLDFAENQISDELFIIEHDVVLMQRSSTAMPELTLRALYGRAFQGLRPGGVVLMIDVVAEQVSGPNQPALPQASMVSVEMLAAGFTEIQQMCLCNSMGQLLIGKKPFQAANHFKEFADNSVCQAR